MIQSYILYTSGDGFSVFQCGAKLENAVNEGKQSKTGIFANVCFCVYSCQKKKEIPYKKAQNVTNIVFIRKMRSARLELIGFHLLI